MKKRGQAWGLDLIIAVTLFLTGALIFFLFALNSPSEGQDNIELLTYEGGIVGDSLLSEGHPDNWDSSNVVRIGLTSGNKINQTKLDNLYNLVHVIPNGYDQSRAILNTKYHYYFNFSRQMFENDNPINGIGSPFEDQNPENLIKVNRFTVYKNKTVSLNIFMWE
jgi:hypothetical protein